uniref:Uncharacterized protein n=1 Tax=Helianthus annuus TaxID=4232 RepID=A0A251TH34_HELAN
METKVLFSGKMQKHCCRVFLGLRVTEIIADFLEILIDLSKYEYNLQRYPWPYWSETSGIQSRKVGIFKDN